jgi:hypothetical protein
MLSKFDEPIDAADGVASVPSDCDPFPSRIRLHAKADAGGEKKAIFRFTELTLAFRRKSPAQCAHPVPPEGRSRTSRTWGQAAVGAGSVAVRESVRTYGGDGAGETVWS